MICGSCASPNADEANVCSACGQFLTAVLAIGTVVASRYAIRGVLGQGGMGIVYKADDLSRRDAVALKIMNPDLGRTPSMVQRFQSELRLARKVRHPNVCRILDCGGDRGLLYIAMELVDGVNLKQALRNKPGLPLADAFDAAIQLAKGLHAIHDTGIIHRDVKTSNVMLDAKGVARLMDFDIAKLRETNAADAQTGQVFGTPEYVSPEQARGETLDVRSDLYSMGVVVFELFSGRVPFQGKTPDETILMHLRVPPPLQGPAGASVPPALEGVFRRTLAKRPEERYDTAHQLAGALSLARALSLPRTPARHSPPGKRTRPSLNVDATTVPTPVSSPDLARLIGMLSGVDVPTRSRAAMALGDIGPAARDAIPTLLNALRDRDHTVRLDAAAALTRIDPTAEEAIRVLVETLQAGSLSTGTPSSSSRRRRVAASARATIDRAIERLRDDDPGQRAKAAIEIGTLGTAAAETIPVLIEALKDDDDGVRWAAGMALMKVARRPKKT